LAPILKIKGNFGASRYNEVEKSGMANWDGFNGADEYGMLSAVFLSTAILGGAISISSPGAGEMSNVET
jgi:hypothetical protein